MIKTDGSSGSRHACSLLCERFVGLERPQAYISIIIVLERLVVAYYLIQYNNTNSSFHGNER